MIKKNGGIFGRNPTYNDVVVEGTLTMKEAQVFDNDITINGDLTVNGTETVINTVELNVDDKNITMGAVVAKVGLTSTTNITAGQFTVQIVNTSGLIPGMTVTKTSGTGAFGTSPKIASVDSHVQITLDVAHATSGTIIFDVGGATDDTADGGGITLKGTTDKFIKWVKAKVAWVFSDPIEVPDATVTNLTASLPVFTDANKKLTAKALVASDIPTLNQDTTGTATTALKLKSNATTGVVQVAGPAAGTTRVMTTPDANFTAARTDAAQNFTGNNTFDTDAVAIDATNHRVGFRTTAPIGRMHAYLGDGSNPVGQLTSVDPQGMLITDSGATEHMVVVKANDGGSAFPADSEMQFLVKRFNGSNYVWYQAGKLTKDGQINVAGGMLMSANGAATGDQLNSGGGNSSAYNGLAIMSNTKTIGTQANNTLPSWIVDIGGRAADGSTFQVTTADKFRVARLAGGGSYYGAPDLLSIDNAGNATVGAGNLVIGTSGKGIDFSATSQAAGMTSELLSDYEEGTWTPTLTTSGTGFTSVSYFPDAVVGRYTKVGNIVTVQGTMRTTAITVGSASGNLRIGGLPYTVANVAYSDSCVNVAAVSGFATNQPIGGRLVGNTSQIELEYRAAANGATTVMGFAEANTGYNVNIINFSATYRV